MLPKSRTTAGQYQGMGFRRNEEFSREGGFKREQSFAKPGEFDGRTGNQDRNLGSKEKGDSLLDDRDFQRMEELEETTFLGFNQIRTARDLLPVYKAKLEIQYYLDKYSCLVVVAEAGSGKTTRSVRLTSEIPQFLLEAGYGLKGNCIAVTLPRRVGVISVANRVAFEVGCQIGEAVGYSVRMESKFTEKTCLKFMTDGSLLKEIQQDPLLRKYTVVMLDDIHERSLATDLLIALLKKIRRKRPELKLVVTSATIDAHKVAKYFEDKDHKLQSKIMTVGGRMYPVQNHFLNFPANNFITKAAQLARDIHVSKPPGDILVFLTGKEEIEAFISLFRDICPKDRYKLLPLHAQLSMAQQIAVMNKLSSDIRKIIVSTNIAESSVTIDGVAYVINSCFTKVKFYDYRRNIDILTTIPCSKSSALQRAGRAGRTRPGECYHLCTKVQYEQMDDLSAPEIVRVNLMPAILQLKALGIANIWTFEYFTKPAEDSFIRALETLRALKLIDDNTNLTVLGKQVQDYPIDIRLAVALVSSTNDLFGCTAEMLTLVAAISCEPIFMSFRNPIMIVKTKKLIGAREGDHLTSLNVLRYYNKQQGSGKKRAFCSEYKVVEKSIEKTLELRTLLEAILTKQGYDPKKSDTDTEGLLRCLCTGFFMQAAQRQPDGSYLTISSRETIYLHPSSILTAVHPSWIIYHELTLSGQSGKAWARIASEVNVDWLTELVPEYYQDKKTEIATSKHKAEVGGAGNLLGAKREPLGDTLLLPGALEPSKVQVIQIGGASMLPKPKMSFIKQAIEGTTSLDQATKKAIPEPLKKKTKAVIDFDD